MFENKRSHLFQHAISELLKRFLSTKGTCFARFSERPGLISNTFELFEPYLWRRLETFRLVHVLHKGVSIIEVSA